MDKKEILNTIISLSRSQGAYCRLLEQVRENPEILNELENKNFKDAVDLVLSLEC